MAISDLAVRLADLAEAEGRLAKRGIFKLAVAVMLLAVMGVLLIATVLLLVGAAYFALRRVLPVDLALLTLGLSIAFVSGVSYIFAKGLTSIGDN